MDEGFVFRSEGSSLPRGSLSLALSFGGLEVCASLASGRSLHREGRHERRGPLAEVTESAGSCHCPRPWADSTQQPQMLSHGALSRRPTLN